LIGVVDEWGHALEFAGFLFVIKPMAQNSAAPAAATLHAEHCLLRAALAVRMSAEVDGHALLVEFSDCP